MQYYDNAEEAFESLRISRTEKFSKRKGNKTLKNLLRTVLKKKYEDKYEDLLDNTIKNYEGYVNDGWNNWTEEKKEREIVKAKKNHSKMIDARISQDLRKSHCWDRLLINTFKEGPLRFTDKYVKCAETHDDELVINSDCYRYDWNEIEKHIELLGSNNVKIRSFVKFYPDRVGEGVDGHWQMDPSIYLGHDNDFCGLYRGKLVGFITKLL